jgi:hypothetical protein
LSGDSPADPPVQGQVIILAMAKQDKEKERIGQLNGNNFPLHEQARSRYQSAHFEGTNNKRKTRPETKN